MMPTEQCYGVVTVYRDTEDLFLVLLHKGTHMNWSFPKGHHEGNETPKETALRELHEETGITDIDLLDTPLIREQYEVTRKGEKHLKTNEYFIGIVKNKDVSIQEAEIQEYKWLTYAEALKLIGYSSRKESLAEAQKYLNRPSV
jgi:tRNA nucleotidyltransferase (CCA-adding enzyme)